VQRRTFLTLPAGAALLQAQTPATAQRAILELRYFHIRSGRQSERTTAYLQKGLVPACDRAGIKPVGCFNAVIAPDSPFLLLLSSYASLAAYDAAQEKLSADKELQAAAEEFNTPGDPSYMRMETSLLRAFPSMPAVVVPPTIENRAGRVFEIRTYEAPNEKGLARKIQLFGQGEFDIFRRLHMVPIFAGQTIVGTHMPNLTYMLGYDDLATREKSWAAFSADAEWVKLRGSAGMADADMVSNTTNTIVKGLGFSQIR
jgi:hypothetical protein